MIVPSIDNSSTATAPLSQPDVNAYIHGDRHIIDMLQADLKLIQDKPYAPEVHEPKEFIILIGNDELE